jgi:hypothetical protein
LAGTRFGLLHRLAEFRNEFLVVVVEPLRSFFERQAIHRHQGKQRITGFHADSVLGCNFADHSFYVGHLLSLQQ